MSDTPERGLSERESSPSERPSAPSESAEMSSTTEHGLEAPAEESGGERDLAASDEETGDSTERLKEWLRMLTLQGYDEEELSLIARSLPRPSAERNASLFYALSGFGGTLLTIVLGVGIGLLVHWWSGGVIGAFLGFIVGLAVLNRGVRNRGSE